MILFNFFKSFLFSAQGQGDPDGAVFKVKGSMVTIRNPSVFPSEQTHGVVKRKDLPARPDDWNLVDEGREHCYCSFMLS